MLPADSRGCVMPIHYKIHPVSRYVVVVVRQPDAENLTMTDGDRILDCVEGYAFLITRWSPYNIRYARAAFADYCKRHGI
jgi:hypothetical protein